MKVEPVRGPKFAALVKKFGKGTPNFATPLLQGAEPNDPLGIMLSNYLLWESTPALAADALARIARVVVDVNDLRVMLESEVVETIGEKYPFVQERALRLRATLNDIYRRQHRVSIDHLRNASRKDQRAYLEGLAEIPPFVSGRTLLVAFELPASIADDTTVELLHQQGIVEPTATTQDVVHWIAKAHRAEELPTIHHALSQVVAEAWAAAGKNGSKIRSAYLARHAGFRAVEADQRRRAEDERLAKVRDAERLVEEKRLAEVAREEARLRQKREDEDARVRARAEREAARIEAIAAKERRIRERELERVAREKRQVKLAEKRVAQAKKKAARQAIAAKKAEIAARKAAIVRARREKKAAAAKKKADARKVAAQRAADKKAALARRTKLAKVALKARKSAAEAKAKLAKLRAAEKKKKMKSSSAAKAGSKSKSTARSTSKSTSNSTSKRPAGKAKRKASAPKQSTSKARRSKTGAKKATRGGGAKTKARHRK